MCAGKEGECVRVRAKATGSVYVGTGHGVCGGQRESVGEGIVLEGVLTGGQREGWSCTMPECVSPMPERNKQPDHLLINNSDR